MSRSRNNALEFSSAGSVIVTNGAAPAGTYGAIQILKDTTLSGMAASNVTSVANLNTSLGAGTILYGEFTAGTVNSTGLAAFHKI
tara:strand:+ start:560 stop:814 length:255 start_codon:yes stop_codon:yes gene_type:complete